MCSTCQKDETLEMATAALESIPEFQTNKRETIESIRDWVKEHAPRPSIEPDGRLCILMSCALVDHKNNRVREMETAVRRIVNEKLIQIVPSDAIDWTKLMREQDGWEGAYAWVAFSSDEFKFSALLLVEQNNGLLGRGQFSMAQQFLKRDKRVLVLRAGKLLSCTVEIADRENWKEGYGRCVLVVAAPAPAQAEAEAEVEIG